jgi:hypothetical protein
MRRWNEDLVAKVRLDLQTLASKRNESRPVELPTIMSLPRYARSDGARFVEDLHSIVTSRVPEDLVRPARAIFGIGDPDDPDLDYSAGIPSLTSRERAIADNGTARRWMRHAVLSEAAIRVATLAAPALLAPGEHETSFFVGRLTVHVEYKMSDGVEVPDYVQIRWLVSPNDKSRCFDWQLAELPFRTNSAIETCVVTNDRGRLRSAVLEGYRPILSVYLGRSAEDEWLDLTAKVTLSPDAEITCLCFDNNLERERHVVRDVILSAAFADTTRPRRVKYQKDPHVWNPPRVESETLEPGQTATLHFGPHGDNSYTLGWD